MAATAVGNLIGKLIPLLKDEVTLLGDVRVKVEGVNNLLLRIQAYLKDADEKAETADTSSHAVKEWVKQLRETAFRVEDAVDTYVFKLSELRRPSRVSETHNGLCDAVTVILSKICFVLRSIIPSHVITSEIDNITESIQRLYEEKQSLRLNPNPSAAENVRMGAPAQHDL